MPILPLCPAYRDRSWNAAGSGVEWLEVDLSRLHGGAQSVDGLGIWAVSKSDDAQWYIFAWP